MSLEYVMQAITLLVVMVLTFVGMLAWTSWKRKKNNKDGAP